MADLAAWHDILRARLSPGRYRHSAAVAARARELAALHGADPDRAELAGLLHDFDKQRSAGELLQTLGRSAIIRKADIMASPAVWHAFSAAETLREQCGVADEEILDAVRYHCTGRPGMSALEKVVYLADFTSPDRDFQTAREVGEIADRSLDQAMRAATGHVIDHLRAGGRSICSLTIDAHQYLCNLEEV